MGKRQGSRGGCLARLLGLVLAAVVLAAPLGVYLPTSAVQAVLAAVYPGGGLDLQDPELVTSWRWLLAAGGGLVAALLLMLVVALARSGARARQAPPSSAVVALQRALARSDGDAVQQAADEIGVAAGDEAVEPLLAALAADFDDRTRQAVAAALYRIGRAVTAEVAAPTTRR